MLDFFTWINSNSGIFEICGFVIASIVIIYIYEKYQIAKTLEKAIDNYKKSNESLESVVDAKDQELLQMRHSIDELKEEFNRQIIILQNEIDKLIDKVEILEKENIAFRCSKMDGDKKIVQLKTLLYEIRTQCPSQCNISAVIQNKIANVLEIGDMFSSANFKEKE